MATAEISFGRNATQVPQKVARLSNVEKFARLSNVELEHVLTVL